MFIYSPTLFPISFLITNDIFNFISLKVFLVNYLKYFVSIKYRKTCVLIPVYRKSFILIDFIKNANNDISRKNTFMC